MWRNTRAGIALREVEERDHEAVEEWRRALCTGFHEPYEPPADENQAALWRRHHCAHARPLGAWEGDRCVGTLSGIPLELTVPGGAFVPADGVVNVSVLPTHRRRGLLTRMLGHHLDQARRRGEVVALLTAAEHGIYGRFGFGLAARWGGARVDVVRSGGLRPGVGEPEPGAGVSLITLDELAELGPGLHERFRRTQPGAVSRTPLQWSYATGRVVLPQHSFRIPFAAVHRDARGRVTGLLTYRIDRAFSQGDPNATLTVVDHLAADRAAAAALWRYAMEMDWVRHLVIPNLAEDDPLPLLLVNPRAFRREVPDVADDLWLRVLDGPRAFAARSYEAPGRTVLDVRDPAGHVAGRWELRTGEDGRGALLPSSAEPELALDAGALGSVYLGGTTVPQLAAAGLVTELRPGAAARAGRQLRTTFAPWCPDAF
ncbi:GNAT family N-acetyltransferase [Streptomyces hoynatensis]|nr:GNAT family N-acetyltransferase [Streptomyces hoynatensis]